MELAERFLNLPYAGTMFYLWGHSYEFVTNNNWEVIEEFAKKMGGNDSIWYATNIEIYDYVQAYNHLVFSADAKTVHNPTATEIFFDTDGKLVSVKPGETVSI